MPKEHMAVIEVLVEWKYAAAVANYENKLFACAYESIYEDRHLDFKDHKIENGRTRKKVYEDSSRDWESNCKWLVERCYDIKKAYNGGVDSNSANLTSQFLNKNLKKIKHDNRREGIELCNQFKENFDNYQKECKNCENDTTIASNKLDNNQSINHLNDICKKFMSLLPEEMNQWYSHHNYYEKMLMYMGDNSANKDLADKLNQYKNNMQEIDDKFHRALEDKVSQKKPMSV